ncbi:hypothetical protein [Tsukamurella paurometabola]|uniref:Uncharacterized protein n=1 Tax=Tsukamurella paurometabola TaxID=2061 RepID=A0ABS5NGX2_TSUPA|nr:hypothetical protein [Tsukamurella paurometabola]MBS4103270.1 hypothetical protein [Tsukamurella paurometabola]
MAVAKGIFAELKAEALQKTPVPLIIDNSAVVEFPTAAQLRAYQDTFKLEDGIEAERERERILLGDAYDHLREVFDPLPANAWQMLMSQVYKHFFGPGAEEIEGK